MTDQGAYVYKENNKLCLMIFAKLPKPILQKALPFEDIPNSDYLQAFFVEGIDYLRGCNKEQINLSIRDKDMISINEFAEEQLQNINSEIIKYQSSYKVFGYLISKKQISICVPISLLVLGVFYLKKR